MSANAMTHVVLTDDDGSGLTGTILNNNLFDQVQDAVDTAIGQVVQTKSGNYTVVATDDAVICTAALTLTLYASSGLSGRALEVINSSFTATVTVDGNAAETIDGALTLSLPPGGRVRLRCNGSGWISSMSVSGQTRETFSGLVFGTHPDADKAAAQVLLEKCKELVFHDGTRVENISNLTCSLAVSGIGGIDTGSEGASRFYEYHVVRKSSDGTLGLIAHRAKSYDVDQSFTTTSDNTLTLRAASGTATDKISQLFTPSVTGPRPLVELNIVKNGTPTGNMWVSKYAVSGGDATGAALETSDIIDVATIPAGTGWHPFVFRSAVSLTSGTQYAYVIEGDYTRNDTNAILIKGVIAGGYAGGSCRTYNGTVWAAGSVLSVADILFKDYVTQNDTAVTMPSGYDQRCLVHPGIYNNSSSDLVATQARDRDVTIALTNIISAGAATFATRVSLAAVVPPVPVSIAKWQLYQSTAGASIQLFAKLPDSNGGGLLVQQAATYSVDSGVAVPVELQGIYYSVSSGAASVYVKGYRW